ncbi:exodeoxyribonuclease VII large subunit [Seleniivibrio woodruffii]|uniref:exodeoxyribonuclease VII large subunit n=1 Tax=Seleniivibrio woodruffii TaxID=1078050 RepID=UPI002409C8BA|nr:exodeoxyribonuclease VII large subunit [Seleniivibrio woodruffii]
MNKFTVTELTRTVKQLLEGTFKDNIAVKGEISSFSVSPAGHMYFVLKDEKSQIKCVMFKGSAATMRDYNPKNGDSVEAIGELTVYEAGGNYQLLVKRMDYDSVGLFWKLFEEVKRKLEAEGLFDEERKRPIPMLPKRAAVVTSATGAAIKDFLVTMKNMGGVFAVDVWSVPVQGKDAIAPIVKALNTAGAMTGRYDVLVLMRGGGSLEDLAVFNEEAVARALSACAVPTVSAIGHERDFSICDFAADLRVATPTAAAAQLSAGYVSSVRDIENHKKRISELVLNRFYQQVQRLDMLQASVIASSPSHRINRDRQRLAFLEKSLFSDFREIIRQKGTHLSEMTGILQSLSPSARTEKDRRKLDGLLSVMREQTLKNVSQSSARADRLNSRISVLSPMRRAERYMNAVERLNDRLVTSAEKRTAENKARLEPLMAKLAALNPDNLLEKGYARVSLNKRAVKSVFDVTLQDELEIRLKDGYINSFVTGRKVSEEKDG